MRNNGGRLSETILNIGNMHHKMTAQHFQPASNDVNRLEAIDSALVKWFEASSCVWSGTTGELLRTLITETSVPRHVLPDSPSALYNHLHNRQDILRSLGIDVGISEGTPRMVYIRQCSRSHSNRTLVIKPDASQVPSSLISRQTDGQNASGDQACNTVTLSAAESHPATLPGRCHVRVPRTMDAPKPVGRTVANAILTICEINQQIKNTTARRDKTPEPECESSRTASLGDDSFQLGDLEAATNRPESSSSNVDNELDAGPVFDNVTAAFLGICEIEKQLTNVGHASSIQFIADATCDLASADGVAIAVAQDGKLAYRGEAGTVRQYSELQCDSALFQHCMHSTEIVQLTDAELVRAFGMSADIKCLIALPFTADKHRRGAIQLTFRTRRHVEPADLIILKAITETVATETNKRRL